MGVQAGRQAGRQQNRILEGYHCMRAGGICYQHVLAGKSLLLALPVLPQNLLTDYIMLQLQCTRTLCTNNERPPLP
jgi:hypothetical protein